MSRILRVFVRKTSLTPDDDLVQIGEPGLFTPKDVDEVHISCVFSWDREVAERLVDIYRRFMNGTPVRLGGPGVCSPTPEAFTAGVYVKKGVTFTTRGCSFRCPWCHVDTIEGKFRELAEVVPGHIVQDNNLLLANKAHLRNVFRMLYRYHSIRFLGGLDARVMKPEHVDAFRGIRVRELWIAYDSADRLGDLKRVAGLLKDFPRDAKHCFVLAGFNGETIEEAEARVHEAWDLGFVPFAQLYQPLERKQYPREWREWVRSRSRPAAMAAEWGRWSKV